MLSVEPIGLSDRTLCLWRRCFSRLTVYRLSQSHKLLISSRDNLLRSFTFRSFPKLSNSGKADVFFAYLSHRSFHSLQSNSVCPRATFRKLHLTSSLLID